MEIFEKLHTAMWIIFEESLLEGMDLGCREDMPHEEKVELYEDILSRVPGLDEKHLVMIRSQIPRMISREKEQAGG